MPLISPIERKTISGRLLVAGMYLLLLLGSVTTVYPFLLMLRLSTADTTDKQSLSPIPAFWFDRTSMARKYILAKHGKIGTADPESPEAQPLSGPEWTNASYKLVPDFWHQTFGAFDKTPEAARDRQMADYTDFVKSLDIRFFEPVATSAMPGFETFDARQRREHPDRSVGSLTFLVQKDLATRDWHPQWDDIWTATVAYLQALPPEFRQTCRLPWVQFLKDKYGQFEVKQLNKAWKTNFGSWTDLRVPVSEPPGQAGLDYKEFVMSRYPHLWISVKGDFTAQWHKFLRTERHITTADEWHKFTGVSAASLEAVPWMADMPKNDAWATLWCQFLHEHVPYEARICTSPDAQFAQYLKTKYSSLDVLSTAWGMPMSQWGDLVQAERLADYTELIHEHGRITRSMTTGPYRQVLYLLSSEGRTLLNTLELVLMALVAALTVNPLAAYALSRFHLRGTHKVLLFFLATMALPGEIAMVPSFLLVRDLGLMNSYGALILPAAASGFGIFLLKGFFDSLPQELFEAATLDGAKEITIFAKVTMPLAQPILAVTALGAVLGAYGTFLGAILYLPDMTKWTLMPRLYQLTSDPSAGASYAVAMSGLVIATLPTLLVFMFAQRMIMRGIVLPSLK